MEEENYLKEKFKEYYEKNYVPEIPEIDKREFGIGIFGKKIANRHMEFKNENELNNYLQRETPFYISYSNAYYKFPKKRPMKAKELIKADLIYEFDADDLKIECKIEHDKWKCKECGKEGKGRVEKCDECGSKSIELEQWFCTNCFEEVKKQMKKLIKILDKELDILNDCSINFSGNAGYHLHLRNEKIQKLKQSARIELLDYLTGYGYKEEESGFNFKERQMPNREKAKGWNKRIIEEIKNLVQGEEEIIAGITNSRISTIQKIDKEKIINQIENGTMPTIGNEQKTQDFWKKLIDYIKEKNSLDIDRQTSTDLNKIIRMPNTIHGGTGLVAKTIKIEELAKHEPLKDCIAFSENPKKVYINKAPRIEIGGHKYGPYENQEIEIEEYAAIFMIAKKIAKLPTQKK